MKFFDAHTHFLVIFKEFYSDFLNFSASSGLSTVFINSETPDGETFSLFSDASYSEKYNIPNLLFFTALHPWRTESAEKWEKNEKIMLENILQTNADIFIGETGLDRLRGADIETQKIIFREHLGLAVKYNRPFTVHCVKEWGNCIDILNSFFAEKNRIPFIIHGFSGSAEIMKQLIRLGGYISFSAKSLIEENKKAAYCLSKADINRIFIETDFPFNAVNKKGQSVQKNSFKNGIEAGQIYTNMLEKGYFKAAEILNINTEELSRIIEKNGKIFTNYTASRRREI